MCSLTYRVMEQLRCVVADSGVERCGARSVLETVDSGKSHSRVTRHYGGRPPGCYNLLTRVPQELLAVDLLGSPRRGAPPPPPPGPEEEREVRMDDLEEGSTRRSRFERDTSFSTGRSPPARPSRLRRSTDGIGVDFIGTRV